jgi:phage gpG-like protein
MPQEVAIQDEKAQKFLEKAMKKVQEAKDSGRAFAMALSAVVFQDIIDHFENEEYLPLPTAPWSQLYRKLQDARGKGGNKLLQDSGRLRQSFLPTNYRKVGEGIVWFNPARTEDGFPYAFAHNEGGPKLPQRTFMWTSDEASEKIAEVTLNFVLGKE